MPFYFAQAKPFNSGGKGKNAADKAMRPTANMNKRSADELIEPEKAAKRAKNRTGSLFQVPQVNTIVV